MIIHLQQPLAVYELGQRSNQEDYLYPVDGKCSISDHLFILCDGMGGHEHGEVASKTVCLTMAEYITKHLDSNSTVVDDCVLLSAIDAAYEKLDSMDDGSDRKMGTTLCLLLFHGGGATVMHIGDSRIYHLRPRENRILYQSKDHSLVYDLYQSGEISYDEMRTSPQKNILTRAIQPGTDNRVKPSVVHITDIQPDDYFFICSDGMLEQMDNDELFRIICGKGTDEKKRSMFIASTMDNKDNHSAWLIHIDEVENVPEDSALIGDEASSKDNAINIIPLKSDDVNVVHTMPNKTPLSTKQNIGSRPKKQTKTILIVILAITIVTLAYLIFKGESDRSEGDIYNYPKEKAIHPMEDGIKMKTISRSKVERSGKVKPIRNDTSKVNRQVDIKQMPPEVEQNKEKEETKDNNSTEVTL